MATVIEEFVAHLGWKVDKGGLTTFKKQVSDLRGFAMTGARYARNFAVGFSAFFNATALAHARLFKLGAATNFQAETLEALDNSLSGTGLSFDTLVKASARFQAQMGDLKLGTASKEVTDALKALKISTNDLADLSPEESFVKVTDAIIRMDDAQIAMSASTALLGQRAAQVVGHYRQQGKTVSEQIDLYRQISLVNDESRKGTEQYAAAVLDLKDILTGVGRYLAGITGTVFAPYVEQLKDWLIVNKELVRTKLKEFVQGVASAMKSLISLGSFLAGLVDKLGGMKNVLKLIGMAFAAIKIAPLLMAVNALVAAAPTLGAAFAAAGAAASAGWLPIAALLAGIFLIYEDLWGSLTGKDSVGFAIDEKIGISKAMDSLTEFAANLMGLEVDEFYQKVFDGFDKLSEWYTTADQVVTAFFNKVFTAVINTRNAFDTWADGVWQSLTDLEARILSWLKGLAGRIGATVSGALGFSSAPTNLAPSLRPSVRLPSAAAPATVGGAINITQNTVVTDSNASPERIAFANKNALERALDRARTNTGR